MMKKHDVGLWDQVNCSAEDREIGPRMLRSLVQSERPVLVMRDVLPPQVLKGGLRLIEEHHESALATRYVNGTLTTIGPYLAGHLAQPDRYFQGARTLDKVFSEPEHDLRRLTRERLQAFFHLRSFTAAQEADGRRYADAVVRIHGDGVRNPLHNDNVMRDAAKTGLSLARLKHQLSCIVCVQECDQGGELILYRRPWRPEDEGFKIQGGLGYDLGVVRGAAREVFRPQTGDVYLINPTNYHEIERVCGRDRITLGFFIGFYDDGLSDAVVWS
jgi:hypothetical protein